MNSSKAIVIAKSSFGEADLYIQFFTKRWGMITALAKSARKSRKRYSGGLDLFCHDEIFIRGDPKETPYLSELSVLNSFTGLRDHLEKMLTAGKITQWIKKLANTSGPTPEVFSLLGQMLSLIEKEPDLERLELLSLVFKLKLLSCLGLKPSATGCMKCSEDEGGRFFFDIEYGGTICHTCLKSRPTLYHTLPLEPVQHMLLKKSDYLRLTQWNEFFFPIQDTVQLSQLLTQFASFHTHTKLPV